MLDHGQTVRVASFEPVDHRVLESDESLLVFGECARFLSAAALRLALLLLDI